ncbi:MAG: TonB-dependent receptor, partial [Acidimicrobiia bacterium]
MLRAYLGKAYFEEKRSPLDADQYSLAKSLDPLDPTAYLYDGIRQQSENQPVAALRNLATSIDLNDNRTVYRSRLLLDKDRAARGASLSRAYRDLGFTQLGVNESTASLALDPSNASAHRFLSDTYLGMRRREIARVSELMQAQLMQDININPVQPSVSETNLNIITIGGPATPGFNEFTPLFERNMAKLDVTGFGGNDDTYGGEGALTALYGRFSFSAGAFHYHSEGWRDNNGLDQHIFDVFAQAAITPELNIQAEFRRRESEEGDLAFNFDPDSFLRDKSVEREQDTVRVGLRYAPTPRSSLLFSYIHGAKEDARIMSAPAFSDIDGGVEVSPFTSFVNAQAGDDGDQFEGQYIYQRDRLNLVAGLAYSDVDSQSDETVSFFDPDMILVGPPLAVSSKDRIKHRRGYLYTNINIPTQVTWTLGFSYDDYEEKLLEATSF